MVWVLLRTLSHNLKISCNIIEVFVTCSIILAIIDEIVGYFMNNNIIRSIQRNMVLQTGYEYREKPQESVDTYAYFATLKKS